MQEFKVNMMVCFEQLLLQIDSVQNEQNEIQAATGIIDKQPSP